MYHIRKRKIKMSALSYSEENNTNMLPLNRPQIVKMKKATIENGCWKKKKEQCFPRVHLTNHMSFGANRNNLL